MRGPLLILRPDLAALLCGLAFVAACTPAAPTPVAVSHDIVLTPDTTLVKGLVPRNTTLEAILRTQGLAADAVPGVISAARTVFDPRRLRTSQPFLLEATLDGVLRHFEYEIDADSYLRVAPEAPGADTLRAEVLPIPKTLEQGHAAGTIDEATPSLFQAMEGTGES